MKQLDFFNTTNLKGSQLKTERRNASNQEINIITIFKSSVYDLLRPDDIHKKYCNDYKTVPITSIRRAITNLTDKGILYKSGLMKIGGYGKPVHTWGLNKIECFDKSVAY